MTMMRNLTVTAASILIVAPGFLHATGIAGTVETEAGTGLEGVEVRILDTSGSYFNLIQTEAGGTFSFAPLSAGSYLLWTTNDQGFIDELWQDIPCAGGCYYFGGTPVGVAAGQDVTGIDFVLSAGGRISGVVTDEFSGNPIEALEVKIYDSEESLVTIATTSGTGTFTSPTGLPANDYFVRTSNDSGYFDEIWNDIPCPGACDVTQGDPISVTLGATTPDINFALVVGGRIAGTVTSSGDGAPIDRVRIDFYDAAGGWAASATPDASGVYATDAGLAPGNFFAVTDNWWGHVDELYDNIPCFAGCNPIDGTPIVVSGGTTGGIDFALDPGGWINGTITDEATGLPAEDVGVEVFTTDGIRIMSALADGSGVYWASGIPTGNYILRAYSWAGFLAEAYEGIPCQHGCDFALATPVAVVQPAITNGIDFALVQGGSITGTIIRELGGAPVEEAEVQIFDTEGDPVSWIVVDPFGRFDSGPIPLGNYFVLVDAWDETLVDEIYDDIPCIDFCDAENGAPVTVTAGAAIDLAIELSPAAAILGTVSSAAGVPSNDCELHLFDSQGLLTTVAFTDEFGAFEIGGLPAGAFMIQTHNYSNLVDELWVGIECVMWCDPTIGTPIAVSAGGTTNHIDFSLVSALLFGDGFDSGDTGEWSNSLP